MEFTIKEKYDLYDMVALTAYLRSDRGCPWDREQTHESIKRNLLEEAYEAAEALEQDDPAHLCEELGDVLLQVMFHADIERDAGHFGIDDVADMVCKKLVERHPHVFGDVSVTNSDQVLDNWDEIKRKNRGQKRRATEMAGVSKGLPALWRAEKIQKKAAKVGFDWPTIDGALDKVKEETGEVLEALDRQEGVKEELGDLLFAVVNVARFAGVDPEEALAGSCDKFISRFDYVEQAATEKGQLLKDMTLEEMDALWDEGKKIKG